MKTLAILFFLAGYLLRVLGHNNSNSMMAYGDEDVMATGILIGVLQNNRVN